MRRTLEPETVARILEAGRQHRSIRQIAIDTGADRATVSAILKKAGVVIRVPGQKQLSPSSAELGVALPTVATDSSQSKDVAVDEAEMRFDWSFRDLPAGAPTRDIQPVLAQLRLPASLSAKDVRLLRGLVASASRFEEAALRLGIDRWTGRLVASESDLQVVAREIEDALAGMSARYRLGGR